MFVFRESLILVAIMTVTCLVSGGCSREKRTGGLAASGPEEAVGDGFKLMIFPPSGAQAGSQVLVRVRIQNVSARPLSFKETGAMSDFQVQMWRDDEPVHRTAFGHFLEDGGIALDTATGFPELRPGDWREYKLDISREWDMTLVGSYRFRVSRNVPKFDGPPIEKILESGEVVSPVAVITVETADPDFGKSGP